MRVSDVLNDFGKYLVTESRKNLTRKKKNDTGSLYDSLSYTYKESRNSFEFSFTMEDYGKFKDKGVKGKSSSFKAPNSPYRFGTGTGKKGGLTNAIDKWVRRKRFQFRHKTGSQKGKFMSYEQTARLITGSIYHKGIETTNFYSRPFELGFKRIPNDIVEAYGLELDNFFTFVNK